MKFSWEILVIPHLPLGQWGFHISRVPHARMKLVSLIAIHSFHHTSSLSLGHRPVPVRFAIDCNHAAETQKKA
jgi:hypothetical protein